jgi:hypothetical protein
MQTNTFLKAVYVLMWYEVSDGIRKPNHYTLHASRTLAIAFKDDALADVRSPNYYFDCGAITIQELASRELYMKVMSQGNVVSEISDTKFVSEWG